MATEQQPLSEVDKDDLPRERFASFQLAMTPSHGKPATKHGYWTPRAAFDVDTTAPQSYP